MLCIIFCETNVVISSTALQLVHSSNHIKDAFKILHCYDITFSFIDANIRVQNPSTSVTEGSPAMVCIDLLAVGTTNQVGSTFNVTLTTTPGKAGTYDVISVHIFVVTNQFLVYTCTYPKNTVST